VTSDEDGVSRAIKDKIAESFTDAGDLDRGADIDVLMGKLRGIRDRLSARLPGLPDDAQLRAHLETLRSETLRTLVASGEWDTLIVGGAEGDIHIFYQPETEAPAAPGGTRGPGGL